MSEAGNILSFSMSARHHMTFLRYMSKILDSKFNIFGFRFGLDPLLGLIPGAGDFISFALSAYMVFIAILMRIPSRDLNKMISNILIDFIIGLIPIVGDISDFVFRANERNLKILQKYYPEDVSEGQIVE